jgi:VWFA-related protein
MEGPLSRPIGMRPLESFAAVIVAVTSYALAGYCQAPAAPSRVGAPQQASIPASDLDKGITTLHTHTNLVVVDVVVTDSKHNPIHGLKESDFTLLENNKPQQIRNFEEHSATTDAEKFTSGPKLPAGLFTNKAPAPAGGPVNVLLLDYLNTPLQYQPYARKQLLEFLDKIPAGTRIAIFGLTEKLDMLQGFTTDPSVLKAALTSAAGAPRGSDILLDQVNGGTMNDTSLSDNLLGGETVADGGFITQEMIDDIHRFEALQTSFTEDMEARYTLAGFQLLARYLVGIPGRKNVIWFSAGFPLNVDPNVTERDPNDSVVRNDEEVRKTDNLLTRAQVAVYPVDARGVFTDPARGLLPQVNPTSITADSGAQDAAEQMAFMQQTSQEHESMFAMAEDTGGEAFVNTNNLTQAVTKAVEDGSNYYTLTYTPANLQWDGRFRAIKLKVVDQPGLKLSYRDGYYADDPEDRSKVVAGQAAMAAGPANTMVTAMMHGGPDPAEILFKVRIRPAIAPPEETPLNSNHTNPDPKVKVEGPFKEYGVDMVPDAHSVSCPLTPTGAHRCALEVLTYVYNDDGELLITAHNAVSQALSAADYAKMQNAGMAFHQEVSVPVKGRYYLRTAIHDLNSDRVGAVEVPVAAVAKLEPLKPLLAVVAPADGSAAPASAPAATPSAEPAGASAAPK